MAPKWKCMLCSFTAFLLTTLILHICQDHGTDANFRINCCVDQCPQTFLKPNSFYKHVKRNHGRRLEAEQSNSQLPEHVDSSMPMVVNVTEEISPEAESAVQSIEDKLPDKHIKAPIANSDDKKAAAFILHLKTECRLNQKATSKVIAGIQAFSGAGKQQLKRKLQQRRMEKGSTFCNGDIDEVFDEFVDPFDGFQNDYSIMKYLKKKLNYVAPVKQTLGKRTVAVGSGRKRRLVVKEDFFHYIPIVDTFQQLMSNSKFHEEFYKDHSTNSVKMMDYCNGTHYRNRPFFQTHPRALQIILYYDDVEICNALGSKSKIHKIGLFYFTLANLHPKYRSRLSSINLLAVCPSRFLTKQSYGIDAVLTPFVEEMLQLEQGVDIIIDNTAFVVHGALIAVVADTLAAHLIAGFKEGVGFSYRKCRHCMISSSDIGTLFQESRFVPRTRHGHSAMCDKLDNAETEELRDLYSTAYGINRRSILDKLRYFDLTQDIPEDLMHVIFEGCLPYTLKQVLKYYIQQRHSFTISQLNDQIENFAYGYMDVVSKPTTIQNNALDEDGVIRQSSSQMWLLGRLLPLFIGQYIDFSDKVWTCYLLLLQIIFISLSPVIEKEDIITLDEITVYFLSLFKECFNVSIRPKLHYLCHLSQQIYNFGPLVRFWCMRYEAKHAYFKSLCTKGSFKNVSLFLAQKHPLSATNNILDLYGQDEAHPCFNDEANWDPAQLLEDQTYGMQEIQRCNSLELFGVDINIFVSKWVEVQGILYKPGCFVVLNFENGMPIFAEVKSVWSAAEIPLLRASVYSTVCFRDELNAFEIEQTDLASALETVSISMLQTPEVYCSYQCTENEGLLIVTKTDIRMYASYDD